VALQDSFGTRRSAVLTGLQASETKSLVFVERYAAMSSPGIQASLCRLLSRARLLLSACSRRTHRTRADGEMSVEVVLSREPLMTTRTQDPGASVGRCHFVAVSVLWVPETFATELTLVAGHCLAVGIMYFLVLSGPSSA
jgi:hypothetical protein